LCPRLLVLRQGQLVADGAYADVLQQPELRQLLAE
jgi:ABC-type branched-subunit amino acid transport system ATPase component